MGAIFSLNIVEYESVEEYLNSNSNKKYFFMLNGKKELGKFNNCYNKFDLVFGNEASGLPEELINVDESVVIKHSKNIDSLNLPISVAMAIYEFNKWNIFNNLYLNIWLNQIKYVIYKLYKSFV